MKKNLPKSFCLTNIHNISSPLSKLSLYIWLLYTTCYLIMCTIFCDSLYFHEFFFLFVNKCPQHLISRFGNNEFWLLNIEYRFRDTCWNKSLMPCPSMGPKWFWTVQIVFFGSKSFWSDPNHFGQVLIRFFWTNFYNLDLSKMIWTWFGPDQNELERSKTIGTQPKLFGRSKIILDP